MNGKGDVPRPLSVDQQVFINNWDRIFNKPSTICEYSGLPNTEAYDVTPERSAVDQRKLSSMDEDCK